MSYKISLFLLLFPLLAFSQNELPEEDVLPIQLYDADVVIPSFPPVYLSGFRFKVDSMYWEKPQRVGIYGNKLQPFIQGDEVALDYLHKYKNLRKAGLYQLIATPLVLLTSAIIGSNYSNRTGEFPPGYVDAMIICGGALYVSGTITFSIVAPRKLKKAVRSYNAKYHRPLL